MNHDYYKDFFVGKSKFHCPRKTAFSVNYVQLSANLETEETLKTSHRVHTVVKA